MGKIKNEKSMGESSVRLNSHTGASGTTGIQDSGAVDSNVNLVATDLVQASGLSIGLRQVIHIATRGIIGLY